MNLDSVNDGKINILNESIVFMQNETQNETLSLSTMENNFETEQPSPCLPASNSKSDVLDIFSKLLNAHEAQNESNQQDAKTHQAILLREAAEVLNLTEYSRLELERQVQDLRNQKAEGSRSWENKLKHICGEYDTKLLQLHQVNKSQAQDIFILQSALDTTATLLTVKQNELVENSLETTELSTLLQQELSESNKFVTKVNHILVEKGSEINTLAHLLQKKQEKLSAAKDKLLWTEKKCSEQSAELGVLKLKVEEYEKTVKKQELGLKVVNKQLTERTAHAHSLQTKLDSCLLETKDRNLLLIAKQKEWSLAVDRVRSECDVLVQQTHAECANELSVLREENMELCDSREALKQTRHSLENELSQAHTALVKQTAELSSLQNKLHTVTKQNNDLTKSNHSLVQQSASQNQSISSLTSELRLKSEQISTLTSKLSHKSDEIASLTSTLSHHQTAQWKAETTLANVRAELEPLFKTLRDKDAALQLAHAVEVERLTRLLAENEDKLAAIQVEAVEIDEQHNIALSQRNNAILELQNELYNVNTQLLQCSETITQQHNDITTKQSEIEQLQAVIVTLQKDNKTLHNNLSENNDTIDQLQQDKFELEIKLQQLTQQTAQFQQKILEQSYNSMQTVSDAATADKNKLQLQLDSLREQTLVLTENNLILNQKLSTTEHELKLCTTKLATLESENISLQNEQNEHSTVVDTLQMKFDVLSQVYTEVVKQCAVLQSQFDAATTQNTTEVAANTALLCEKENQIADLASQISDLQASLDIANATAQSQSNQNEALETELQQLSHELTAVKYKIAVQETLLKKTGSDQSQPQSTHNRTLKKTRSEWSVGLSLPQNNEHHNAKSAVSNISSPDQSVVNNAQLKKITDLQTKLQASENLIKSLQSAQAQHTAEHQATLDNELEINNLNNQLQQLQNNFSTANIEITTLQTTLATTTAALETERNLGLIRSAESSDHFSDHFTDHSTHDGQVKRAVLQAELIECKALLQHKIEDLQVATTQVTKEHQINTELRNQLAIELSKVASGGLEYSLTVDALTAQLQRVQAEYHATQTQLTNTQYQLSASEEVIKTHTEELKQQQLIMAQLQQELTECKKECECLQLSSYELSQPKPTINTLANVNAGNTTTTIKQPAVEQLCSDSSEPNLVSPTAVYDLQSPHVPATSAVTKHSTVLINSSSGDSGSSSSGSNSSSSSSSGVCYGGSYSGTAQDNSVQSIATPESFVGIALKSPLRSPLHETTLANNINPMSPTYRDNIPISSSNSGRTKFNFDISSNSNLTTSNNGDSIATITTSSVNNTMHSSSPRFGSSVLLSPMLQNPENPLLRSRKVSISPAKVDFSYLTSPPSEDVSKMEQRDGQHSVGSKVVTSSSETLLNSTVPTSGISYISDTGTEHVGLSSKSTSSIEDTVLDPFAAADDHDEHVFDDWPVLL